jgi:hypothetical protein
MRDGPGFEFGQVHDLVQLRWGIERVRRGIPLSENTLEVFDSGQESSHKTRRLLQICPFCRVCVSGGVIMRHSSDTGGAVSATRL